MTTSSSLYIGNSLAIVPALPDASITAVVTSPPYNLASSTLYSPTFADSLPVKVYIANHVALFRAYDRIVKSDGQACSPLLPLLQFLTPPLTIQVSFCSM